MGEQKSKSGVAGITAKRLAIYFDYLDTLRDSGITNMYGASPYLASAHKLDRDKSVSVLSAWMKTFDGKLPAKERAETALKAA